MLPVPPVNREVQFRQPILPDAFVPHSNSSVKIHRRQRATTAYRGLDICDRGTVRSNAADGVLPTRSRHAVEGPQQRLQWPHQDSSPESTGR